MKTTDKMRLDWLESQGAPCGVQKGSGFNPRLKWRRGDEYYPTLRAAIDAAIRASRRGKPSGEWDNVSPIRRPSKRSRSPNR